MKRNKEIPIVLVVLFLISTAGVVEGANIISNPGFELGTTSWNFYASGGGTFTTPPPGFEGTKYAKLYISNSGTNIQLYQDGLTLEANTLYRLSFAAKSNTGHDLMVNLMGIPYSNYGLSQTFHLGTNWQTFQTEFTTRGFSGTVSNGRLQFWLSDFARAVDVFYIDDIRLEKVDISPPIVTGNTPTRTGVPMNTQITVTFNESMNQSSAQSAFLTSPATTGSFAWSGNMMTFTNDSSLLPNTIYNVTVGTGAKDLAGNSLQSPYKWNFTTAQAPDTVPPTVIDNTPQGTGVQVSTEITVIFDEPMNQSSAQKAFSTIPPTKGSFVWSGDMMTFTPDSSLLASTKYTVTIGTGAKDLAGNNMESFFRWNFTTSGEPPSIEQRLKALEFAFTALDNRLNEAIVDLQNQINNIELIPGPPGPNGLSCWDINKNGIGDLAEDVNGDGNYDTLDCKGAQGLKGDTGENGPAGTAGTNGLACWDINKNGIGDPAEDVNGDGNYDALDCKGAQGLKGDTGDTGPAGAAGVNGLACWDINKNGIGDPAEDINGDGNYDTLDCKGAQGLKGDTGDTGAVGPVGANGLACWDLNGNGTGDPAEDINGDGNYDTLDCKGVQGLKGDTGDNGSVGPAGANGLACWDINGNGTGDPAEDINRDGNYDTLDCKGAQGPPGSSAPSGYSILGPTQVSPPGYTYTGDYIVSSTDSSGSWVTKAPMPTGRSGLAAAAVNNKIYAIGGVAYASGDSVISNQNEEYDPVSNSWTTKAPMLRARTNLAAAAVNNKIYAMGGWVEDSTINLNEEYDPVSNSWATKAPMPTARQNLAAVAVNNKIYAIGGGGGVSIMNEEYDPVSNLWTTKAPMPTARADLAAASANNKIYAIGGSGYASGYLNITEEYDPVSNSWTTKAPMPTSRTNLAATAVNNKIYAIGGDLVVSYSYLNLTEEYDPASNSWTTKAPMPMRRTYLAAAAVNNKIYAIGGYNFGGLHNLTEEFSVYETSRTYYIHLKN